MVLQGVAVGKTEFQAETRVALGHVDRLRPHATVQHTPVETVVVIRPHATSQAVAVGRLRVGTRHLLGHPYGVLGLLP